MSEITEIYFNVIMPVIYILEGLCANLLYGKFADIRGAEKHRVLKYLPGAVWAVFETVLFFTFSNEDGMDLFITLLSVIAVTLSFSLLINKGSFLKRIFPAVLFIAVREAAAEAAGCLTGAVNIVTDSILDMALDGTISPESYNILFNTVYCFLYTVIAAVRIAAVYLTIRKLVKIYSFRQFHSANVKFLMIPALTSIIANGLIKMLLVTLENGYTVLLYSKYPLLYIIIPLLSITLISAILLTFRQCRDMAELQMDNAEKIILENQITQMQNSLSETEQLYDSIRSVKHDIKNNMAVMQSLLQKKCPDDGEIKAYFNEMLLSAERLDNRVHTGNAVCDSIISGKFRYAEKAVPDIKLDADDFLFSSGSIKAYDIGIILSNGLDNAVEACISLKRKHPEKQAFITVKSFKKRGMFFIEIQNSFDGFLTRDSETGTLLSSKDEPELHGIGLRNIKKCALKYSGGMDIIVNNNIFTLSLMLKEDKNVNKNK